MSPPKPNPQSQYLSQAAKLSLEPSDKVSAQSTDHTAVSAHFITPQDPVITTAAGGRLPAVPLKEAVRLNQLREDYHASDPDLHNQHQQQHKLKDDPTTSLPNGSTPTPPKNTHTNSPYTTHDAALADSRSQSSSATLSHSHPPYKTHPLFPELPLYGPPTLLRKFQCLAFRGTSAVLSLAFLMVIVLGSAFTSIPLMVKHIGCRLRGRDPDSRRPFYEEEKRRKEVRRVEAKEWRRKRRERGRSRGGGEMSRSRQGEENVEGRQGQQEEEFVPTEGGKDPLICDVGYYARRVGLDVEEFKVQTEDGFIIDLWHVYNPRERARLASPHRRATSPTIFPDTKKFSPPDSAPSSTSSSSSSTQPSQQNDTPDAPAEENHSSTPSATESHRYPILLIHGLLQSAGAYCANDDDSLAFYLAKSGYDVWLGNNRCGFRPHHQLLHPSDPRMWNWNIRQMGVLDLPALISRVLSHTGFEKLGLVCHSQGTTEAFVALAKGQRPDLGTKVSVFCALAPAVYAGPLIGKMYFKFMRIISPGMFRIMFGIHAFIPFMMTMHRLLPGKLYGALGYRVFSFLFNWTDDRWDQGIRDRLFQFAPVYVSAESMRWWLGRECFATQKCILATREERNQEDREDEEDEQAEYYAHGAEHPTEARNGNRPERRQKAWYDEQAPPFALWVAGADELVDGRRLLRRFERGREPHVKVVHSKVIDEYEHLDVLWAMDAVDKVAKEVRQVLWKTVSPAVRSKCRVPTGCQDVEFLEDDQ